MGEVSGTTSLPHQLLKSNPQTACKISNKNATQCPRDGRLSNMIAGVSATACTDSRSEKEVVKTYERGETFISPGLLCLYILTQ